jgi:ArsR family transcriptional regulator
MPDILTFVNERMMMARASSRPQADDNAICCTPMSQESLSAPHAENLAEVFAALGDPVRLRLFSIISATGEVCSCNLEGPLERSQPTISHHTKILAEAGLILGEKRGRWVWWRVVPDRLEAVRKVLGS